MIRKFLFCIVTLLMLGKHAAAIELPEIISDNMVLQQQADARLWGWAEPGSPVIVETAWNGKTYETTTSANDGRWEISVATPEASYIPTSFTIEADGEKITIENVLIGEVWFCSGQSNMEMPLRGFGNQPVEGAAQTIAYSGQNKGIRVATVPKLQSYEVQDRVPGKWKESNPENAGEFSAVAYYFAESLNRMTDVPVGVIVCAYGGSKLESWMPRWKLDQYGEEYSVEKEKTLTDKDMRSYHRINVCYNAMLHPLVGYTVKGFLWNQGESNVGLHADYPTHQADMVQIWRDEWGQGELPFYFVEIPGWNYGDPSGTSAALLREAQHKAAEITPRSEYVCTADLVYPYEIEDIHASRKQPIGERLAMVAAANDYGIKGLPWKAPTFKSMETKGNKATLHFNQPNSGFTPNVNIPGFEVAGADGKFYPARVSEYATPDWSEYVLVVSAPEVDEVKAVRYAFKNFYPAKVHDMLGQPLVPFRTDTFPQ